MSKKFTGVHSGGQNIPVYDKDAHSAIEQKLDTSAFQSVSGNFLTAVPDAYATKEYAEDVASSAANAAASGKLDTDTFSQVSGDFLTAVPQSYLQNTDLTVTSGKVTEISGIPLSAGGTLPDTIPVSGVSGISVTETENEVLIGISADFATSSDLEKKLDTSAFSSVSGNFLTAVPENYSTKEYLSEQISGKYDTSSFAAVSGDFLTAVPESAISGFATHDEVESAVSGKQDVSAMSAYQEKGDYYSASNPSGFLTEIPQSAVSGYMETSGLEYDGDKISGYMGSAFKAGDELPSGVMVESAVGYNAVNEISGYNGSAIAQYGAEKQWLVHDGTLCHLSNSAQYALGVNLSAVAQLLGVDETILASSTNYYGESELNLSESLKNFKRIKVLATRGNIDQSAPYGFSGPWVEFETDGIKSVAADIGAVTPFIFEGPFWKYGVYTANADFTKLTWYAGGQKQITTTGAGTTADSFTGCVGIKAVIGIGRKS